MQAKFLAISKKWAENILQVNYAKVSFHVSTFISSDEGHTVILQKPLASYVLRSYLGVTSDRVTSSIFGSQEKFLSSFCFESALNQGSCTVLEHIMLLRGAVFRSSSGIEVLTPQCEVTLRWSVCLLMKGELVIKFWVELNDLIVQSRKPIRAVLLMLGISWNGNYSKGKHSCMVHSPKHTQKGQALSYYLSNEYRLLATWYYLWRSHTLLWLLLKPGPFPVVPEHNHYAQGCDT